ncbi:MAG: polysaccharide biosynthesis C-terminal domain-containing protein [Anaerolineaceae bacterium]|nr:polysaccharide biosynthesis C-terminal domain-containing protein [Anaerolineaceae bacterium]
MDAKIPPGAAWALAFYALGIAGFSLLEVQSRAFYALSDTWTPVIVGIAAMVSNIALSVALIQVIGEPGNLARGPFAGLALANAVTTIFEALALWWLLRRRIGDLHDRAILNSAGRTALAALGMGAVLAALLNVLNDAGALIMLVGGGAVGAAVFFGLSLFLGVDEARTIPRVLLRRVRRT